MTITSWVGILFCLVPSLIFLAMIKGVDAYRLRTLIVGCTLVLISTMALGIMTDLKPVIEVLMDRGVISEDEAKNEETEASLWLFMFPAVVGAIGANLITSWFQAKKT